jgi:glucosamine--fructose-6-phosphate aminotransferase (isomerizing)
MIEGIIPAEIAEEPAAIRDTLAHSIDAARSAAAALRSRGVTRVHVIGNGTSYHSSIAAATLYRRYARADEPAVVALTAGEFRNYPPALGPTDAVIGISASGEFRDVLAVVEALRGRVPRVPTVAIVHVPGSTLDRIADHVVRSAGGPSSVPVMTKTFASTLVATELVLAELLGGERAARIRDSIALAADHAAAAIAAAEPRVAALADALADARHLFVVGSGAAHPAALEAALKLKEMAIVHAEGTESWEMASGVATIVDAESVVVALAPHGPGCAATLDVARHAAGWGARVIEVAPASSIEGADLLPIPAAAEEDHAPLTTVAPVALLAFALARRRGHDPDHPGWVERYHSQGLRHIVGVGEES